MISINSIVSFWRANTHELIAKTFEQLYLVGFATLLAIFLGLLLGILLSKFPKFKNLVMTIAAALWTIPSLALFAFFIPFLGIGIKPAIVTLAIYAILPILRNTVTGIDSLPSSIREATEALGFTNNQRLFLVELPLALPIIMAGIRIATAMSVGIATLAAFIGAGGLGDFINEGLALNNSSLILLGAIPAAAIALFLDFTLSKFEQRLDYRTITKPTKRFWYLTIISLLISITIVIWIFIKPQIFAAKTVRIASKNFTESIILGEITAQMIEAHSHLTVIRNFNLGTTAICQTALINGEIDMYPEYTGTAYLTVLHKQYTKLSPQQIFQQVKDGYEKQFKLVWLPSFGFNNTQAIAVREDFARRYHLKTISDLYAIKNNLTIAAPAEFVKRPDGLIGLEKVYRLHFKAIKQMDPNLIYEALQNNQVNVINAFSTDGRIFAYHLIILQDNKHLYPPYNPAIVIRANTIQKYPEIVTLLHSLFGVINEQTMRRLNYDVDIKKETPAEVARKFLISLHMIK